MEKPNIADYHEVPSSTITGTNYNYKRYSQSLENYINYLEKEVKKLNKLAVSNNEVTACDHYWNPDSNGILQCTKCHIFRWMII